MSSTELDTAELRAANRVMWISTIGFTIMFAAWLMFGILGVKIQEELGLTKVEFSWIAAVAILNGSLWRLPAGMITDRIGGRKVMTYLLASSAIPAYFVSQAESYTMLLILAFLVGFAGNSFTAGTAWNAAWQPRERQGFALGLFGAGNVGASVTKLIGPGIIGATTGSVYLGFIEGGWRFIPVLYAVLLVLMALVTWFGTPSQDKMPGHGTPLNVQLAPSARSAHGGSACTTWRCSGRTWRCPPCSPPTTSPTSTSRSPLQGSSPLSSSSPPRCSGRWAVGSTGGVPGA